MLDHLPEDLLVNILSRVEPLEDTLAAIPCVCRAWSRVFERDAFWILFLLAKSRGVSIGRRHAKRAFIRRNFQQKQARRHDNDRAVLQIVKRLERTDCVALVRKQQSAAPILLAHRIFSREHRTLLHYACWYGRTKTIKFLLENNQSSAFHWEESLDDNQASPLLLAAWAGHAGVVRLLLSHLDAHSKTSEQRQICLDRKGIPPLTSSCGGKGPKNALCWATRKGFAHVVRLLKKAGATVGSG